MNPLWEKYVSDGKDEDAAIAVCIDDTGRFLIVRRSNIDERSGQWTIPGGHVDPDDKSLEGAASRELEEEAGLVALLEDLQYLGESRPGKHYFLAKNWSGDVNVSIPNPSTGQIEHDDFKWATIEEIKDIDNSEIPIYLLEKALDMSKNDE
jgi:8-oxo-dGTP pyrophosphatase MutT (NUDIX family)